MARKRDRRVKSRERLDMALYSRADKGLGGRAADRRAASRPCVAESKKLVGIPSASTPLGMATPHQSGNCRTKCRERSGFSSTEQRIVRFERRAVGMATCGVVGKAMTRSPMRAFVCPMSRFRVCKISTRSSAVIDSARRMRATTRRLSARSRAPLACLVNVQRFEAKQVPCFAMSSGIAGALAGVRATTRLRPLRREPRQRGFKIRDGTASWQLSRTIVSGAQRSRGLGSAQHALFARSSPAVRPRRAST